MEQLPLIHCAVHIWLCHGDPFPLFSPTWSIGQPGPDEILNLVGVVVLGALVALVLWIDSWPEPEEHRKWRLRKDEVRRLDLDEIRSRPF